MTGTKKAKAALIAYDILGMYIDGKGDEWNRIIERYGVPRHPETKSKMNSSELRTWASATLMGDGPRQAAAAVIFADVLGIARDTENDPGPRLAAYKLAGQEVGVFNNKMEHAGAIEITEVRNVIVRPEHKDG